MEIKKELLLPFLLYNTPIKYNEHITLHPVTMNDVIVFQTLIRSFTVRKDSTFNDKKIIKMTYLEFLLYCLGNEELEHQYNIHGLSSYFIYAIQLLQLCCKDSEVKVDKTSGQIAINDYIVTPQVFDDLRRIILIQNDVEFDIDEFLNYDTEMKLRQAQEISKKDIEKGDIEDYIDSLIIAMNTTEERVMNMTIRKFWRYIRRYQLCENYKILKTGECSGMVTFKNPIKYWMVSLDVDDKYAHLKTDEDELRSKIG